VKSRLVLSLGLSIGAGGVEPGVIRTANETGEITLVCVMTLSSASIWAAPDTT
jgi:hypothetical protein